MKKCKCPEGFPIESTYTELHDSGMRTSVTILGHTGTCPLADTILRYG